MEIVTVIKKNINMNIIIKIKSKKILIFYCVMAYRESVESFSKLP